MPSILSNTKKANLKNKSIEIKPKKEMIKEVILHTIICDNCGRDAANGTDYSCSSEPWDMFCEDEDWQEIGDGHYCPDCYEHDDDDNLIIKPKKK